MHSTKYHWDKSYRVCTKLGTSIQDGHPDHTLYMVKLLNEFCSESTRRIQVVQRKKENLSFTLKIMGDTTRVGESMLTNENTRVSLGYLPIISHVCAHRIGFY